MHSEVFVLNCGLWVDHVQHITGTKHSAMSLHKGRVQENIPRLSQMKWGPGTQPLLQFNKPTAHSQNVLKDFSAIIFCGSHARLDVHASSPLTLMSFTHTSKEADPHMWGASTCCLSQETRCHGSNLTLGIEPRSSLTSPFHSRIYSFLFAFVMLQIQINFSFERKTKIFRLKVWQPRKT